MAIIKDLQKVAPFGRIEYRQAPIIKDEELNASEVFEQAAVATVAPSKGERLEEARDAIILNRTIITAGFVSEGAGNPTLAEPGCPCDEEVLIAIDPVAGDKVWRRQRGRCRVASANRHLPAALRFGAARRTRGASSDVWCTRLAASRSTRSPTRSSNDRASRSGD